MTGLTPEVEQKPPDDTLMVTSENFPPLRSYVVAVSSPRQGKSVASSPPPPSLHLAAVASPLQGKSYTISAPNLKSSNTTPSFVELMSGNGMSPPVSSNPPLLWASRIKSSLRNLQKCSEPEFLEDGTPVVVAPDSIILASSEVWKDHIIAHFTSTPPSAYKIYSDLNPIWGKHGNISVRQFTNESCLILIPSESTRSWVLDVGYWQAGNCSFTVSQWTPSADLHPQKLTSIPIWVILHNIPPQLYSLSGISIIASAIGEPMHTEKSRLSPIQVGEAKIKVEIRLKKPLPPSIVVRDSKGNSVKIDAEYPRPPPKCVDCDEFGHTITNCPKGLLKKKKLKDKSKPLKDATVLVEATSPISQAPPPLIDSSMVVKEPPLEIVTTSQVHSASAQNDPLITISATSNESSTSISSSQYADIDKVLSASQSLLNLPSTQLPMDYKDLSPKAKKRARKKQRQAFMEAHKLAIKTQARMTEVNDSLSSCLVPTGVGGAIQA